MIKSGAKEFLIDGFPRAMDQALRFEEMIKPCEMVLFFDCPEEVMEARLLKRGETSGRSDDNAETIRKRFRTFVDQSLPVIDHYEALGKAHKISATRTPDQVFESVQEAIDTMVRAVQPAAVAPNGRAAVVDSGRGVPQRRVLSHQAAKWICGSLAVWEWRGRVLHTHGQLVLVLRWSGSAFNRHTSDFHFSFP
jgi:hypothetical protein